jgi:hypothetical protein
MTKLLLLTLLMPILSIKAYVGTDVTGAWTLEWKPNFSGQDQTHECEFKQDGRKLTINCDGAML